MRHLLLASLILSATVTAQRAPDNGPRDATPTWHALVGARVVIDSERSLDHATVVIRKGRVVSVKAGSTPPAGARVWDCSGLSIYPAFVDAHVPVEAPKADPTAPGTHWNAAVHPQRTALDGEGLTEASAKELRKLGFAVAAITPKGGIFRGSTATVYLDKPKPKTKRSTLRATEFQSLAFERNRSYPASQMGAIALIRQTLLDAQWHAAALAQRPHEIEQAALLPLVSKPKVLFDTRDELEALRALQIAKEFNHKFVLVGSGLSFRRAEEIAGAKATLIVPLAFPKKPAISTLSDREAVSLRDMWTWEQAPTNPRRLLDAGISIALTSDKLKDRSSFLKNMRVALRNGLTKKEALRALTTTPAKILGIADCVGRIAPGMAANLLLTDGELFAKRTKHHSIWIRGRHHALEQDSKIDITGSWLVALKAGDMRIDHLVVDAKHRITVFRQEKLTINEVIPRELTGPKNQSKARALRRGERQVDFSFDSKPLGGEGTVTLNAVLEGNRLLGTGALADGRRFAWGASRISTRTSAVATTEPKKKRVTPPAAITALPVPLGAYGLLTQPSQLSVIIHNATIWTSGPQGIIENATLVTKAGKIVYVGPSRSAPNIEVDITVDAEGQHLTPGLIDCHSHTGISKGINEGTQAVTSEVRIGDVINPDDVGWYRELAGGLTVANQLHGSANPIGGQNSVVKLRWGAGSPESMKLVGAPAGIKFALGENVKQANRGDKYTTRYPQTRMGVEAILRDRFIAAREYDKQMRKYAATDEARRKFVKAPRRDLELDALVEILHGDRLIHCHSYRQDEILMLCRIAEEFGFIIGTFQHGLECYKVATEVKRAALGASIFTDWWAYKFEVIDAIPENGAILHEVGVTVSFNSDSNELARHLNTEAAKAVKYGGVDPAEALKFVTINPAKQLRIDHLVGSLETGKDADFVIWSGNPLSGFSRCLETWIDGRRYYSTEDDLALRERAERERQRLIQKILNTDESDRTPAKESVTNDEYLEAQGSCGCSRTEAHR